MICCQQKHRMLPFKGTGGNKGQLEGRGKPTHVTIWSENGWLNTKEQKRAHITEE